MRKALGMVVLMLALTALSAVRQRNPSQPRIEALYSLLQWPDGITALAIILTLGAIVWQSDETRRSARSAEEGMRYLVAKEQPRLAVNFVWDGFIPPSGWEAEEYPELAINFTLSVVNQGLGNAYDVRAYASAVVLKRADHPRLETAARIESFPTFLKAEGEPVETEIPRNQQFPRAEDAQAISERALFMHLFGYIRYVDPLGYPRSHPFRWHWKPFEWYEGGQLVDESGWIEVYLEEDQKYCAPRVRAD